MNFDRGVVARFSRLLPILLSVALCMTGVFVFGNTERVSAGPAAVMFGYVPLPADDMQLALETVHSGASPTLRFTVGITNAAAGSTMYYDQWEDGYETDIANPSQSSTLIFGDGNTGNGNAATFCAACVGDTLPQGAPLVMQNDIPTPRVQSNHLFDGGDKIASTRGFAITAGGFTTPTGSVLSMVVSAYDTSKYANDYTAPVGTDTPVPLLTSDAFNYSGLLIQASADGTDLEVDKNADGTVDTTATIGEGETYLVNGGVLQGATVHSSKPVMVHEITGDTTATYESRAYNLFPDKVLWSDYMSPAGSSVNNFRTVNFLYNPNDAAISVYSNCASCTSDTINVPAHGGATFTSPLGEAVRFNSSGGEHFIAVAGVGAQSGAAPGGAGDSSSTWDWGYTLIPTTQLTTQVVLGWAPGNSNVPPISPSGNRDDDPVWVTTLAATTIAVDYDGDPTTGSITADDCFGAKHDATIPVAALASTRIYDATDGDMTGARIYTCDGTAIAGAWGEDPQNAPSGAPGFDAGYTLIPTTTMLVHKTAAVADDANHDGATGPGDTLTYVIEIADAGSLAFSDVKIADTLPAGLTYVPDSTVLDDGAVTPLADDNTNVAATAFPLDETGLSLPDIDAGDTVEVRFDVTIDNPVPSGASIGNTACVTAAEAAACDTSITSLAQADLSLTKTLVTPPVHAGDNATFRLTLSNAGPDASGDVVVTDLLTDGLVYVSDTGSGAYDHTTGEWTASVASGAEVSLDITAKVTGLNLVNTAQITRAGVVDPDSVPGDGEGDDYASVGIAVDPTTDIEVTNVVTDAPDFLGDTATFLVTLTNKGPSDATGLSVMNTIPGALGITNASASGGNYDALINLWKVPNLAAGVSQTLTFTTTMLTMGPVATVAELVHGNEYDPDSGVANGIVTEDDYAVASVLAVPAGSIGGHVFDDLDGDGTQDVGEPGIEGATVTLRQNVSDQFISSMPTIADGGFGFGTLVADAYYLEITSLPAGYVCTNCATSKLFTLAGGQSVTDADYGYRAEADLSITNTLTNAVTHVGDSGEFTVVVTNHGPDAATGVSVKDLLPGKATFVSATPTQGAYNPGTGAWTVGSLAVDASATLKIQFTANAAGAITTTAEVVAADQPDPDSTVNNHDDTEDDQDDATASTTALIDLELTQSGPPAPVNVGSNVDFVLTLKNDGPSAATAVIVDDTLPAGLDFVSATPSLGTWTAVSDTWSVLNLGPGATATLTIKAKVTTAGSHHNLAQVVEATEHDVDSTPRENAFTSPDEDDEAAASVTGRQIDLSVEVTASKTSAPVGDNVTWTIAVHNDGPSTATDVQVSDLVPTGLTFKSATTSNGVFANGVWSLASLAKDGSATLTIVTRVDNAGVHVNTAQVKAADEPDVDSTPNNSVATEDDQDYATVTGTVGSVPGTLWIDTNANGVQDAGEPAMPAVVIKLIDDTGKVVATATTDSNGKYSFANVAPGVYTVAVDPTSLPDTLKQIFDVDSLLDGKHTITVTGTGASATNFAYTKVAAAQAEAPQLPRTGGTSQLPLVGLLASAVLAFRARRRVMA